MIGKRKREIQVVIRSENASSGNTDRISDQDIFRQHFESHFEPLPEAITSVDKGSTIGSKQNTESDATVGSDWEGLLGEKLIDKVEVVEYGEKTSSDTTDDVPDAKAFMSTKPPVPENSTAVKSDKQKQEESLTEDHAAEAMNLKHDLELQQLLRESHLLEKSSGSALTHTHRQKAIDMRIQALGAKSSIFTQTNMPVSHRRGIMAKANQREKARRKEAKENSIVLEREVKTKGSRAARRERGIGAPTVGKFKGGTLRLSRRDIGDIQGRSKGGSVPRKRRK